MIRSLLIAAFFFTSVPLLIAVQWVLEKLRLPGWGAIATRYYGLLSWVLGLRIRVVGTPTTDRAVLYVSNHVSWADILVIGSIVPVAFVSKAEVRKWPLVGLTAKLQRTVFVDRTRRHQTGDAVGEMVKRLQEGISVVLFAEGTSNDGNRVLPFRSSLLGAVKHVAAHGGAGSEILVQPMAICYTGVHGIPMGRLHRPLAAWYGDLDFMPHIKAFIACGAVDVTVTYGKPIAASDGTDRKAMTRYLEGTVRQLAVATLHGKVLPAKAAE